MRGETDSFGIKIMAPDGCVSHVRIVFVSKAANPRRRKHRQSGFQLWFKGEQFLFARSFSIEVFVSVCSIQSLGYGCSALVCFSPNRRMRSPQVQEGASNDEQIICQAASFWLFCGCILSAYGLIVLMLQVHDS
jgi:hypothetical protein